MHCYAGASLAETKREIMMPAILSGTRRDLLQPSIYILKRLTTERQKHKAKVNQRCFRTMLNCLKHPPNQRSFQLGKNPTGGTFAVDAFAPNGHRSIKIYCDFVREHDHIGLLVDPKVLPQVIG